MKGRSKLLVTVLGGWFGLHKYIEGKISVGILYTLTFGLFGIGWIYDSIKVLFSSNMLTKDTSTTIDINPSKKVPETTHAQIPNDLKMLTTASKITFALWTLDALYMLFSGESGINFFQWFIVYVFGCFVFVGIAQIISSKRNKKRENKPTQNQKEYEQLLSEYQKALHDLGTVYVKLFKEHYYVNAELLNAEETATNYRFIFAVDSKEQLNCLLNNRDMIHSCFAGNPTIKYLHGNYIEVISEKNNNSMSQNSTINFDYMEGHEFEHYCANLLAKNSFTNVEVTKGSGDQGIDIIAYKDGIKYGIQCKCYSSDIGNKAVQEAFSGKTFYDCHVAVVLTNRYFTPSAKELAQRNGVLLWDREKLIELINNSQ